MNFGGDLHDFLGYFYLNPGGCGFVSYGNFIPSFL